MDNPTLTPTAITTCLMLASLGVTGISQAGLPDQDNIGAQALYALMASQANSNSVNYLEGAVGEAAAFSIRAISMPTCSILHPTIY
jgi:hypothetical protein